MIEHVCPACGHTSPLSHADGARQTLGRKVVDEGLLAEGVLLLMQQLAADLNIAAEGPTAAVIADELRQRAL